ncbi:MAG: aldo/keto reductase [Cyanobacteria bacterium]|nr:aldo/keto reductase [Cyanobacteriota bacterium]
MKRRKLGRSTLEVAPLAFGGNVFGWTADEATSFKLLDGFIDAGLNLIDTADIYSAWKEGNQGGESETIIGRWMKINGRRDEVVIATKCGMDGSTDNKNLSGKYIKAAVDRSLQRLQTDYIDLYQAHVDDDKVPLEESLEVFNDLVKQGKVRAIGASNYSAERFAKALEVSKTNNFARYETLQPEYNLYDRQDFEETLEPLCLKEQVGVICYFSLARGFLSGKYKCAADLAQSERGVGVKKYLNERGFRIIKTLDDIAAELKSTPARVALAWLIARPSISAPIASATRMEQLTDLIESVKLELSPDAVALLNTASEEQPVSSAC